MMKQICYGEKEIKEDIEIDTDIDNKKIDDLFYLIINYKKAFPKTFNDLIEKLELNYSNEIIQTFQEDNLIMLKHILYILYELDKEGFSTVLSRIKRDDLFNLYNICKTYNTDNFLAYYKRTIINKYSNNST